MSETQMPAAEVTVTNEQELVSYEFAFHVLPTVAEGEVPGVFESIKTHITKAGGEIFGEENPQRFDLAYDIVKYLEGKNRKFSSAYFGWVRFRLSPSALVELAEHLDGKKELLRYLFIKLTKVEEQNPFNFHESIVNKRVQTITDEDVAEEGESDEEVDTEDLPEVDEVVVEEEVEVEDDSTESK
ncbi:MAG: 30S ribosomal protein S6 [Candidatus Paceibacterota bacterium]